MSKSNVIPFKGRGPDSNPGFCGSIDIGEWRISFSEEGTNWLVICVLFEWLSKEGHAHTIGEMRLGLGCLSARIGALLLRQVASVLEAVGNETEESRAVIANFNETGNVAIAIRQKIAERIRKRA